MEGGGQEKEAKAKSEKGDNPSYLVGRRKKLSSGVMAVEFAESKNIQCPVKELSY